MAPCVLGTTPDEVRASAQRIAERFGRDADTVLERYGERGPVGTVDQVVARLRGNIPDPVGRGHPLVIRPAAVPGGDGRRHARGTQLGVDGVAAPDPQGGTKDDGRQPFGRQQRLSEQPGSQQHCQASDAEGGQDDDFDLVVHVGRPSIPLVTATRPSWSVRQAVHRLRCTATPSNQAPLRSPRSSAST